VCIPLPIIIGANSVWDLGGLAPNLPSTIFAPMPIISFIDNKIPIPGATLMKN